jgi:hypothetical protein
MKRYNIKSFYGSYGHIIEHNDGSCNMEIIWNTCIGLKPYRKKYKTLKDAKIALGRMCDVYTLTEYKGDMK